MNKLNSQGKWGQTQRWRAGCQLVGGALRGERIEQKGLMDVDNSVMIAGGWGL